MSIGLLLTDSLLMIHPHHFDVPKPLVNDVSNATDDVDEQREWQDVKYLHE